MGDTELLSQVGLFLDCTRAELAALSRRCDEVRVPSGTAIVEQGGPGDRFYVLAEGLASVHVDGRRVASVAPGAFFGEMALIDREGRSATVLAELPCRLLVIEARDFDRVRSIPSVNRRVLQAMSRRLRAANAGLVS